MKCSISIGVVKAPCDAGETQSTHGWTWRASAISSVTFGPGRTPPWPGLAPCESFSSIIFTCGSRALAVKRSSRERAVVVAAAEVARADLPDQVAAVDAVVPADRAFAGVVREVAALGAGVQRQDGVRRERPEAHRRDVEDAGAVGLGAAGADQDAEVVRLQHRRLHRVVDPLVADRADVHLGAERSLVGLALGALIDQRALLARERRRLAIALDEVLAHLRPDELEQEAQVADHRVVAQDRVARLHHVAQADQRQGCEDDDEPEAHAHLPPGDRARDEADDAKRPDGVADRKVVVELADPREHGRSSLGRGGDGRPARCDGRRRKREGVGRAATFVRSCARSLARSLAERSAQRAGVARKAASRAAVSAGSSSGMKWAASIALPSTVAAHCARQSASGS